MDSLRLLVNCRFFVICLIVLELCFGRPTKFSRVISKGFFKSYFQRFPKELFQELFQKLQQKVLSAVLLESMNSPWTCCMG